jgi:predicted regulator of Ras-like GTPase activity (Roadblock/LC7/MglB family)
VAAVAAPALTPDLALQYLHEMSVDIRAAVLVGADGSPAAATVAPGDAERLATLAAELFQRADGADAEPVSQVEASTGEGTVFAVRQPDWTLAVVAGRFALPSLMFYDLRAVLGDLGKAAA